MRVLVTRPSAEASGVVQALRTAGHDPVLVPLLELRFEVEPLADLARAVVEADVVLLTSAAAVDAVAIAAPRAWRRARWAAVGPATAQRLRDHGLPVHVVPARATADDLVRALGDPAGLVVVAPRADLAQDGPLASLRAAGAVVHDVVAYTNTMPPGAAAVLDRALPVDATTLFSSSAASRLAALVPLHDRARLGRVVVIGPSTASTCREVGLAVAAVADPYTLDGVLSALGRGPAV